MTNCLKSNKSYWKRKVGIFDINVLTLDLQTRKLNLITYLTQVEDEVFLEKLENYILKREEERDPDFKPLTVEELVKRIGKSELDFKNGKFKSQDELEKISDNW